VLVGMSLANLQQVLDTVSDMHFMGCPLPVALGLGEQRWGPCASLHMLPACHAHYITSPAQLAHALKGAPACS
jgi:hypothetical protein